MFFKPSSRCDFRGKSRDERRAKRRDPPRAIEAVLAGCWILDPRSWAPGGPHVTGKFFRDDSAPRCALSDTREGSDRLLPRRRARVSQP